MLEVAGLHKVLPVVVTREQDMRGKPSPDIFLIAAQRMQVEPASAVVFEDAITGVEAARSAGTSIVAVTTSYSRGELSHADLVIDDFTDPALLDFFALGDSV